MLRVSGSGKRSRRDRLCCAGSDNDDATLYSSDRVHGPLRAVFTLLNPVDFARSVKHRLLVDAPVAVDRRLDLLRHGSRTVLVTPEHGMRLGNLLYLWLHAHIQTRMNSDTRVLWAAAMDPWLATFPAVAALTLPRAQLRFGDLRDRDHPFLYQRFGVDFTREQLGDFVRMAILPHVPSGRHDDLVINVRRGDYYSDDSFRTKFGFDQLGYLEAALEIAGDAPRTVVVSDDPVWCRAHLGPRLDARGHTTHFEPADPLRNFLVIARSQRIIGTNSTFSYWASYVAGVVHDDARVIMPLFHARMPSGTKAYQLDPTWTALDGFH